MGDLMYELSSMKFKVAVLGIISLTYTAKILGPGERWRGEDQEGIR